MAEEQLSVGADGDESGVPAMAPTDDKALQAQIEAKNKEIAADLKAEVKKSIDDTQDRSDEWQENIDRRLGIDNSPSQSGEAPADSPINPDWPICITKEANLFSQAPSVNGQHEMTQFAQVVPIFLKAVRYELGVKRIDIGVPIGEGLADIVNASGFGTVFTEFVARVRRLPNPDDPSKPILVPTDGRIMVTRISPFKVIRPVGFTGSDYNRGPFIGYRGEYTWSQAVSILGVTAEQKDSILGTGGKGDTRDSGNRERRDGKVAKKSVVNYDRIFYWRYLVDEDEPHFDCIWEIIFVDGLDIPVKHEPWKGQRYDEQSHRYLGNTRFPVQLCSTTYVSDNPTVPSDTKIIKPQVKDSRRSRANMFASRKYSIPMIWANTSAMDPEVMAIIMSGDWDGVIPVNGMGDHIIGQVTRPQHPPESFDFDARNDADMKDMVQLGALQNGVMTPGRHTQDEVNGAQENFATLIGKQRAAVARWFLRIVDNVIGWMVLIQDFPNLSEQEKQTLFQGWDMGHIAHDLALNILPDSTIMLDSQQEANRQFSYVNRFGKSGFVNPMPFVIRGAELAGQDPSEVVTQPTPKQDPIQMSIRISSTADLMNPLMNAYAHKAGYMPDSDDLKAGEELVQAAARLAPVSSTPVPPAGVAGAPPPSAPSGPGGGGPPAPPLAGGPPPVHPDQLHSWTTMPTIVRKERENSPSGSS